MEYHKEIRSVEVSGLRSLRDSLVSYIIVCLNIFAYLFLPKPVQQLNTGHNGITRIFDVENHYSKYNKNKKKKILKRKCTVQFGSRSEDQ